jgi:hypothetical protein
VIERMTSFPNSIVVENLRPVVKIRTCTSSHLDAASKFYLGMYIRTWTCKFWLWNWLENVPQSNYIHRCRCNKTNELVEPKLYSRSVCTYFVSVNTNRVPNLSLARAWILRALVWLGLHTLGSGFCRLKNFTQKVGLKLSSCLGFTM